ncbi:glycosyltransferase family 29 protein [Sphingobacterium wenxiniae]|uniref:Glycosyltransferase family 29 (Sialyltransferase) n=1 Tax=Sphingobacterium wenxiniae TaxID=683125 RepID=A0A1I6U7Z4_9SPHI|nr:glycosyltransferase family 29 protein [Sphingobacterium wenxiniae]SFS97542.1 Glycosyltransferase family 29 (sialyltransferase) [Sphingobacterium wenxiniae]
MINKILRKLSNLKKRVENRYSNYLFERYKKKALIPFDEKWFKDKRVAIVGGADSAFKDKLGNYIDNYDVVVRINKGVDVIERYSEYIGKRTDILFHSLGEGQDELNGGSKFNIKLWKKMCVEKIIFPFNSNDNKYNHNVLVNFFNKTKGRVRICELDYEQYQKIKEDLQGYSPTTGFAAIHTILNSPCKEVYITGVTFFKTPHNPGYRQGDLSHWIDHFKKYNNHSPDSEFSYFLKKKLEWGGKLKVDSTLSKIIS